MLGVRQHQESHVALLLLTGGTFEWSGDYSDSSRLWTSSLRAEVDTRALQQTAGGGGSLVKTSSTVTADDGSFWMKWGKTTLSCRLSCRVALSLTRNGFDPSEDFVLYFEDAGTCNPWLFGSTNHCASGKWVSGVSAGGPIAFQDSFDFNPKFELQIDPEKGTKSGETVRVNVTLCQPDIRGTATEDFDLMYLYVDEEDGPKRKMEMHRRLQTDQIELATGAKHVLTVCNSRPGVPGSFVLSVTTEHHAGEKDHSCKLATIAPPSDGPAAGSMAAEKGGKTPPRCFISGRPADYTKPHLYTDHGFVFGSEQDKYMATTGPICAICGEMIIGTQMAKSRTTGKVMHVECAQGGQKPARGPESQPETDTGSNAAEREKFSSMRPFKLREECKKLGLSQEGSKEEMVARLLGEESAGGDQPKMPAGLTPKEKVAWKREQKAKAGGGSGSKMPQRPQCSICGETIMDSSFLSTASGEKMHKSCYVSCTPFPACAVLPAASLPRRVWLRRRSKPP